MNYVGSSKLVHRHVSLSVSLFWLFAYSSFEAPLPLLASSPRKLWRDHADRRRHSCGLTTVRRAPPDMGDVARRPDVESDVERDVR